jgi:hypothetical protein
MRSVRTTAIGPPPTRSSRRPLRAQSWIEIPSRSTATARHGSELARGTGVLARTCPLQVGPTTEATHGCQRPREHTGGDATRNLAARSSLSSAGPDVRRSSKRPRRRTCTRRREQKERIGWRRNDSTFAAREAPAPATKGANHFGGRNGRTASADSSPFSSRRAAPAKAPETQKTPDQCWSGVPWCC